MHWLAVHLGLTNASGAWYLWWSGVAGDLGFLGAGYALWRKHSCHVGRCFRVAHHDVGPFRVCRKHHPGLPDRAPTAEEVACRVR